MDLKVKLSTALDAKNGDGISQSEEEEIKTLSEGENEE